MSSRNGALVTRVVFSAPVATVARRDASCCVIGVGQRSLSPGCRSHWNRRRDGCYWAAAVGRPGPSSSRCNRTGTSELVDDVYRLDCLLLAETNQPTCTDCDWYYFCIRSSLEVKILVTSRKWHSRTNKSNFRGLKDIEPGDIKHGVVWETTPTTTKIVIIKAIQRPLSGEIV